MVSLIRWTPLRELSDLRTDMEDMMQRVMGTRASERRMFTPIDVLTRGEDLVVRAELPGIDPEKDVEILVQDDILTIRGERRYEEREEEEHWFRVESRYGSFERDIPLPEDVHAEDINASYRNGVLEVVIPHAAKKTEPRRIQVRGEERSGRQIEAREGETKGKRKSA